MNLEGHTLEVDLDREKKGQDTEGNCHNLHEIYPVNCAPDYASVTAVCR